MANHFGMHLIPNLGKTAITKKATGLALPAAQKISIGQVQMTINRRNMI